MNRVSKLFVILIITIYSAVGFLVYSDYGISWDEAYQHDYGKAVYEYVFHDSEALLEHNSRYHGPVFQLFLYGAEKITGVQDSTEIFRQRHLLTFLFSVLGIGFFYLLLRELRFNRFWSIVGLLLLVASPRIFAHSFYNSKDVVFMHGFITACYTLVRFIRHTNWRTALLHGIACGLLIDIRILGFFVPVFTIVFWSIRILWDQSRFRSMIFPMSLFGICTLLTMVAFWPTLWHDPIGEFMNALTKMSDYPWDDPILFEGRFQLPKELPWYYLLKWILISTPVFILVAAAVGSVGWVWSHERDLTDKLLPLFWIVLPLSVIIWKHATVYDGWRHVFFIYPAIIILAAHGAQLMFETNQLKHYTRWIAVVLAIVPLWWMVRNHPQQQVYFNPLARNSAWSNYEMDYWGLSYHEAYQWLIEERPEVPLKLAVANAPGFYNHWLLPEKDRNRISFVALDSADLFLSNFRYPSEHEPASRAEGAYQNPIWLLEVDGNRVCGIFEVKR